MSDICRSCRHERNDHDPECQIPEDDEFQKGSCPCQAFNETPIPVEQLDIDDIVLQEAARHLAGLGRGKYHRIDVAVGPNDGGGSVKLDGVELRGVTGYMIEGRVGDLTRISLSMIVSVGQDNPP